MPFLGKPTHPAFSLIEILITIAISAILTAIVFVGLKDEQQRSAAKDSADRLQVELIGLQNKIQSAIALPAKFCIRGGGNYPEQGKVCNDDTECFDSGIQGRCVSAPPSGYGLSLIKGQAVYRIFADQPLGVAPANGIWGTANDQNIEANKPLGSNITVYNVFADGTPSNRLDLTFQGTDGHLTIFELGNPAPCSASCTSARIVLRNSTTGVCYAIDVSKNTGIVSKRKFSPSCT